MCLYEQEQVQKPTTRSQKIKAIRNNEKLRIPKTRYIQDQDFDTYQKVLRAIPHRYIYRL